MDEARKNLLSLMFGSAAPIMDLTTCAKVLYKPFVEKDETAWMPIGWETHQPMIFVMAQDKVKSLLKQDGSADIEMVTRSYVCMDALTDELKLMIRQHLGLASQDGGN